LNYDMEIIHSLSLEAGIGFLDEFYAKYPGEYYLSLKRLKPGLEVC